MALPWRYSTGAPAVVSAQFRCITGDPDGDSGVRGLVATLKLVVSAPFRLVSDDPLGVSVVRGDRGLIVTQKLVASVPFRLVGLL